MAQQDVSVYIPLIVLALMTAGMQFCLSQMLRKRRRQAPWMAMVLPEIRLGERIFIQLAAAGLWTLFLWVLGDGPYRSLTCWIAGSSGVLTIGVLAVIEIRGRRRSTLIIGG